MPDDPNPNPNPPTPAGGGLNPGSVAGNPGAAPAPAPTTPPNPAPPTNPPAPAPDSGEKLFSQADLDRIVKDRLKDEQARAERRIEDAKKQSEQDKLREQGEFKTLSEQRAAELEELKAEIKRKDREALCVRIAGEEKLPASFAARLVGDDEAAIREDAKKVFADIAAPSAPNAEGGQRGNGSATVFDTIREGAKKERETAERRPLEEVMRTQPGIRAR